MSNRYLILTYIYMYGPIVLNAALLVLGIVILFMKDKDAKVLGLAFIVSALAVILSINYNPILARSSHAQNKNSIVILSYIGTFIPILAMVLFMLYAKAKYDAKGAVTVLCIMIADIPVNYIFNKHRLSVAKGLSGFEAERKLSQYDFARGVVAAIIFVAAFLFIFDVYKKNKDSEDLIPHIYLLPLLALLCHLVIGILYGVGIAKAETSYVNSNITMYAMFALIVKYVIFVIFAGYVVKREAGNGNY